MPTELLLEYATIGFVVLCVGLLALMAQKRMVREFPLIAAMLAVLATAKCLALATLFFRQSFGLSRQAAYTTYFYSHWISYTAEAVLQLFVIYSVFSIAMKPLQGLHQLGKIIFRWVAAVSIMVSVAIVAGPHFVGSVTTVSIAFVGVITQASQGISVLTLCLLLFVCFSTKPLGLTYRSRVFGILLGLGVMAMTMLVQAAWSSVSVDRSLYSPIALFGMIGMCISIGLWGTYFAMPEPERRMILLPTTSPFFFWNRISEALGDEPGHVVIAGFHPDMLAAAELEMFSAPSLARPEPAPIESYLPALHAANQY